MSLDALRKRIDAVDAELVALLSQRAETAVAIGAEKRRQHATIHDPIREQEVLARVRSLNRGVLSDEDLTRIFEAIMAACSRVQEESAS